MKKKKIYRLFNFFRYIRKFYYVLFIALACASCGKPAIYDQNPGSKFKPLETIEKALELSRTGMSKNIIIREGKYYEVSCKLSAIDSGLNISGEPRKDVYLYGGKKLTNWKKEGDWFVADAPGTADRSWDFRVLIVNDTMQENSLTKVNGHINGRVHREAGPKNLPMKN
jgi:predicted nucleic-acid-binding Zn-ribbon protein